MLTVRGRRSGRPHSTPVSVMRIYGQRWLVAPYVPKDWVKNARIARQITLSRGGFAEVVAIEEEHDPTVSAPILKLYFDKEPITRRYFDADRGSPLEAFADEAHRHPVFRILDLDGETTAP